MSGRGRGRGPGEDYGHGNGRDIDYGEKSSYEERASDTNGHTGGGGDSYRPDGSDWQHLPVDLGDHPDAPKGSSEGEHHDIDMCESGAMGGSTGIGKMQRVGDKWVFVRTEASEVA